jgi:2-oxoglutarate dehydrogenase E1 component
VLANVVRKPMTQIFKEFTGKPTYAEQKSAYGTGDVKYHLGTSYDRPTATGAPPATCSHAILAAVPCL